MIDNACHIMSYMSFAEQPSELTTEAESLLKQDSPLLNDV